MLVAFILVADRAFMIDDPATVIPELNTPAEFTLRDDPIPTLPVKSDNPLTLNPPEAKSNPVVVNDPPIPTLPEKFPVPVTSRVVDGAPFPIPNLEVALSQKRLAL